MKARPHKTGFAQGRASCFAGSFAVAERSSDSYLDQMKYGAITPRLRNAAKRYV